MKDERKCNTKCPIIVGMNIMEHLFDNQMHG